MAAATLPLPAAGEAAGATDPGLAGAGAAQYGAGAEEEEGMTREALAEELAACPQMRGD